MSDKVVIDVDKRSHLDTVLGGLNGALNKIAENVSPPDTSVAEEVAKLSTNVAKWLATINETQSAGFAAVVAEIAKLQLPPPPRPKMKGTIMADFAIPDDTPDGRVTFAITATDAEGQPITDPAELAKLKFDVTGSNDDAFVVTMDADQPDPANRVGGYHVGAPGQAVLTENLSDADGNIIATGSDGFTVTTGKVALGSVKATFDGLTPIS